MLNDSRPSDSDFLPTLADGAYMFRSLSPARRRGGVSWKFARLPHCRQINGHDQHLRTEA